MTSAEPPLYRLADGVRSACSNVHNVEGAAGRAGAQSRFPRVPPGDTLTVADLEGPAIITRLWLTFDWPGTDSYEGSMLRNRSLRLDVTWDDADAPAVSVPVGDFFCHPLCYDLPFENALFADPTGRSSLCFIPMPFRRRAHLTLTNEFDRPVTVFHDIRFLEGFEPGPDDGYLHACFRRTVPQEPGPTHEVLPSVRGRGRYLGTHMGIITDRHNPLHWHAGNLKFFLDGDDEHPSMMGASLDDFGGASWAYEKKYMHRDSGLILSRSFPEGGGHFGLYFYHRRDPLYFGESCAVSIRPIAGLRGDALVSVLREHPGLAERITMPPQPLEEIARRAEAGEEDWFELGRLDDLSTVALYYLDRPGGDHELCTRDERCTPAWQWPASDADTLREEDDAAIPPSPWRLKEEPR